MERLMIDILLKQNFGGYEEKELKEFKNEKSTLHNIVHSATGSGKTYFIKEYSESITSVDKMQQCNKL